MAERLKQCIICGKNFVPSMSSEKVCSDECRKEKLKLNRHRYEIKHREERNSKRRCHHKVHIRQVKIKQPHIRKNVLGEKNKRYKDENKITIPNMKTWMKTVEYVMSLPYPERFKHTLSWGNKEHSYAKKIEIERIRDNECVYEYF